MRGSYALNELRGVGYSSQFVVGLETGRASKRDNGSKEVMRRAQQQIRHKWRTAVENMNNIRKGTGDAIGKHGFKAGRKKTPEFRIVPEEIRGKWR